MSDPLLITPPTTTYATGCQPASGPAHHREALHHSPQPLVGPVAGWHGPAGAGDHVSVLKGRFGVEMCGERGTGVVGEGGGAAGWYGFELVVRKQEIHPEAWFEEALLGVHLVVRAATWLQPFERFVSPTGVQLIVTLCTHHVPCVQLLHGRHGPHDLQQRAGATQLQVSNNRSNRSNSYNICSSTSNNGNSNESCGTGLKLTLI